MPKNIEPLKNLRDLILWELQTAGVGASVLTLEEDVEGSSPMHRSLRGKLRYLAAKDSNPRE